MHISTTVKKGLVFGIGGCLFVVGVVLGGCFGVIFDAVLFDNLGLTDSSLSFDNWKEVPLPVYMEFNMFNWENPECFSPSTKEAAIKAGKDCSKPEFTEKGPYVFKEEHTRVNLTWNDNDTVTYQQIRVWHFEPSMSNGSLDDQITTLNPIAVTAAYYARLDNWLVRAVIDGFLNKLETLAVTHNVQEFIFDGYQDELIDITNDLQIKAFQVPFKKFAWFFDRNGSATYDGVFNMHTGIDDLKKLGIIYSWNYQHQTSFYNSYCAVVNGTSGELGPPLDSDVEDYYLFIPDFCASLDLKNKGATIEVNGVEGIKFEADGRLFDNGTNYPEQRCFTTGEAVPCGAMNISLCKWNAPAFVSFPHFYMADESYVNAVKGMAPDSKKHEFYYGVEPNSGVPLTARARMQINMLLQPYDDIKMFKTVPRVFMPIFWFTQKVDITSDLADMVKLVVMAPAIGYGTLFGIAGIGLLILLVGVVITVRHGWGGGNSGGLVAGRKDS